MQKALDFRQWRNRNDHRMPVVVTVYCKQARLSTPQGAGVTPLPYFLCLSTYSVTNRMALSNSSWAVHLPGSASNP